MSDCGCNPAVGVKVQEGAKGKDKVAVPENCESYSPREVRLYGRPGCSGRFFDIFNVKEDSVDIATDGSSNVIDMITVMSIKFPEIYYLPIDVYMRRDIDDKDDKDIVSIGVIYGYSYEGHCYKMPKPQIMFLPKAPQMIPDGDCGCDCGYSSNLGYALWRIDKLKRVTTLEVRSDDVKTLVLDENIPGNRSPLAYSQTMRLAPNRSRDY
jgi:hypothetical protein